MLALSMWQPWATLHVAPCSVIVPAPDHPNERRAKIIETRSWPISTSGYVNLPATIAIHATKAIGRDDRAAIIRDGGFVEPFGSLLEACGYSKLDPWSPGYDATFERRPADRSGATAMYSLREGKYLRPLPRGAVVGVVTYYRQVRGTDVLASRAELANGPRRFEIDLGYYDETREKRFGWVSRNAAELYEPIPCAGAQKLWTLPPAIRDHPHIRAAAGLTR